MINILIVDDEYPARVKLKHQLANIEDVNMVAECDNAVDAISQINALKPDVILLDINLGELDGFDVLDALDVDCHVIFTTAYNDYAIKAFENRALDYLLKPFPLQRLREALERVPQTISQTNSSRTANASEDVNRHVAQQQKLTAKAGEKVYFIPLSEVLFVSSRHGLTLLQTIDREYVSDASLDAMLQQLPKHFIRVHRNAIANCHNISELERWRNGAYLVRFTEHSGSITTSRNGGSLLKQYFEL